MLEARLRVVSDFSKVLMLILVFSPGSSVKVFKTRPAPCAILDEVDAALDEANNDRFNRIVQEFVTEAQFIIITHSKRTMGIGDRLYGITMQEPGVSKVVGVDLNQALPHHLQKSFQLQVEPPRQGASAH